MYYVFKYCYKTLAATFAAVVLLSIPYPSTGYAATDPAKAEQSQASSQKGSPLEQRRMLIHEISELTQMPWTYLAALDQYERTLTPKGRKEQMKDRLIGIIPKTGIWSGWQNPNQEDRNPTSIALFGGFGRDATGDGIADPTDDRDVLYSMAGYMKQFGITEEDIQIALWRYYQNERAVDRIGQFAQIYQSFDSLDLYQTAFVLPLSSSYSYRSTWGEPRGFGGIRIHEGTDLFAPYGVPVKSTCYGIVETKGWNRFGGWRIGIRDLNNRYHYYAHLMGFDKKMEIGSTVIPGQVVGWVGSSGYGNPGTQGKFPPHLHYGIYRDAGHVEWAFDPYPLLKRWENEERKSKHK